MLEDLAVLALLPTADLGAEPLAFIAEPLVDFGRAVFFTPLFELAVRPVFFELAPREVLEVDLDVPGFDELDDDRDDFEPDEAGFERAELDDAVRFDLDDAPDPLDVRELLPDRELPDFDVELLDDADRPDLVLVPFDPLAARLEERLDVDLRVPEELFEPVDLPDEPDLVLPDFLVVDLDPEDFFEGEDFDPEDFFEDEDFDPEDFLVAAMTLTPRFSF